MLAIGQSLMLAASLSIVPHYFKKKLSLANGLVNCFASILVVLLPYCTSIILRRYGLREAFYFFAFLNLVSTLLCMAYTPRLPTSNDAKTRSQKVRKSFGIDVFRKPKFVIWSVASFFGFFGYLIPIINIVSDIQIQYKSELKLYRTRTTEEPIYVLI